MKHFGGFFCVLLLASCAGREAQPVQVVRSTDMQLSCIQLDREQLVIDADARKLAGKTDKTVKNASLAAAGAFLLVPYFFIDLSEAEEIELNALRARYMRLERLKEIKRCSVQS
ncbi:MAG: hypothetical protein L7V32_08865 [Luminiphilus sp.]|nr:hypothetical protein [Luminiphilus sp.]